MTMPLVRPRDSWSEEGDNNYQKWKSTSKPAKSTEPPSRILSRAEWEAKKEEGKLKPAEPPLLTEKKTEISPGLSFVVGIGIFILMWVIIFIIFALFQDASESFYYLLMTLVLIVSLYFATRGRYDEPTLWNYFVTFLVGWIPVVGTIYVFYNIGIAKITANNHVIIIRNFNQEFFSGIAVTIIMYYNSSSNFSELPCHYSANATRGSGN